jgi:ribonuclease HI
MNYNYVIFTDGGCHLHTTNQMYGSYKTINRKGKERVEYQFDLGKGTNNQAEILTMIIALNDLYKAIINSNKKLADYSVLIYTDSMLIKQQATGEWSIRDEQLRYMHEALAFLIKEFKQVDIAWVSRDKIVKELGH